MKTTHNSRRRFIQISAAFGGALMLNPVSAITSTDKLQTYGWQGIALGADASLYISHTDAAKAQKIIDECIDLVHRLESLFSLYDENSALVQLNSHSKLVAPSSDFLELLNRATEFSRLTNGKFDVSVQPLWEVYANPSDNNAANIKNALTKVGWENIDIDASAITLNKDGMALTFNGIAQGYITDKVTQLLARHGLNHALVNMGEIYGLNPVNAGKPWIVGIENANKTNEVAKRLPIRNQAVATSGGYGTLFNPNANENHLLDPQTGTTSNLYSSVTVVADNATTADAMSTAFSLMPASDIKRIASQLDINVYVQHTDQNGVLQLA